MGYEPWDVLPDCEGGGWNSSAMPGCACAMYLPLSTCYYCYRSLSGTLGGGFWADVRIRSCIWESVFLWG